MRIWAFKGVFIGCFAFAACSSHSEKPVEQIDLAPKSAPQNGYQHDLTYKQDDPQARATEEFYKEKKGNVYDPGNPEKMTPNSPSPANH